MSLSKLALIFALIFGIVSTHQMVSLPSLSISAFTTFLLIVLNLIFIWMLGSAIYRKVTGKAKKPDPLWRIVIGTILFVDLIYPSIWMLRIYQFRKTIERGDQIIGRIEKFRTSHGRSPADLAELQGGGEPLPVPAISGSSFLIEDEGLSFQTLQTVKCLRTGGSIWNCEEFTALEAFDGSWRYSGLLCERGRKSAEGELSDRALKEGFSNFIFIVKSGRLGGFNHIANSFKEPKRFCAGKVSNEWFRAQGGMLYSRNYSVKWKPQDGLKPEDCPKDIEIPEVRARRYRLDGNTLYIYDEDSSGFPGDSYKKLCATGTAIMVYEQVIIQDPNPVKSEEQGQQ